MTPSVAMTIIVATGLSCILMIAYLKGVSSTNHTQLFMIQVKYRNSHT